MLLCNSVLSMAQEKQFTLEDLNFGGRRYHEMSPERRYYEWWGDKLVRLDVFEVLEVDSKDMSREQRLFGSDELADLQDTIAVGLNMLNASFPYPDKKQALLNNPTDRLLYDFETKTIVWKQSRYGSLEWNSESRVDAFLRDDNLWLRLPDGMERQLTTDGSREIVYGKSVHRDEFGITKGTFFSPDGQRLAFYRMDQSMVADYPQVNTFTSIATHEPDKYPMTGMTSHEVNVGIHDITANKTIYLQFGDVKDRYFTNICWSPDGSRLYLFEVNRQQDCMMLREYDALTGNSIQTLYTETDKKYVEPLHPISFLPWDANKILMFSQKDGFMRLYLMTTDGKMLRALTDKRNMDKAWNQDFVVLDILGYNAKEKSVIVKANLTDVSDMNIISIDVNSGAMNVLGTSFGVSAGKLSASGSSVLKSYSNPDVPRAYEVVSTSSGAVTPLFTSRNPWEGYSVPDIRRGDLLAADGKTMLRYRMVLPKGAETSGEKYPTVVYVYGGPHAHLVDNSWNYLSRSWEIYMAQKGYVVFILDGRGSENRGKEFEQCTFRQLGQVEMQDQLKGVEYLKSLPFIDAERLGIHGWSYGGYMTISLMVNYPDVFKVGVAGGPVTDWRWYEVMYGERYMDTSLDNPDGYRKTSLISKAKNLQGRLQIIIGANDPVVVPQHALRFIYACNEAGTQPDFYIYPGEGHNMMGHMSVHLHERITRYFEDFLK